MCQRIDCSDCGKPSFAGCGRHVESVLGDVPASERCHCRATSAAPPARAGAPVGALKRFLGLLGGGRERRRP